MCVADEYILQFDPCQAPGLIQGGQGGALHARCSGVDGEQADPRFPLAARRTRGDDQQVRLRPVDDLGVTTAEVKPPRTRPGDGLHAVRIPSGATGERQGRAGFATGNRAEPALLQRRVVSRQQGRGGQAGGGEKRRAQQKTTTLFQQDRQLDKPQAHTPETLGDHQGRPAQLQADALPDVGIVAVRANHGCAHGLGVAGRGEKALGAVANHQVFLGKGELHGGCLC
ncbi:hypothetical protein D3C87_1522610 [compost metagenome]